MPIIHIYFVALLTIIYHLTDYKMPLSLRLKTIDAALALLGYSLVCQAFTPPPPIIKPNFRD